MYIYCLDWYVAIVERQVWHQNATKEEEKEKEGVGSGSEQGGRDHDLTISRRRTHYK